MQIIFALMAFFGWGTGDIFSAISTRRVGNIKALFWQLLLATLITSFFIPFSWPVNYRMLFYAAFLGLFNFVGSLTFFKGFEVGNVSLVGAVAGSFPLIVILLSRFIYGETLTGMQLLGVLLILAGLILVSFKKVALRSFNFQSIVSDKGLKYALITMVLWGVYFTFVKIPVSSIGWFWPTYTFNLTFIFLLPYFLVTKKSLGLSNDSKTFVFIFLSMILITLGNFSYNVGVSKGFVSLVAPVAGSYPVLFVFLSRLLFRETLTRLQIISIILTLLGIVIISFP